MAGPVTFAIPGRGEKIHALLCSRPESLEEIPPTSFEMLGVLRSLTSVTGLTSQGAMVVMRVDMWRHLNASSRLRAACPACLHQGGCLSKGQSTNTFAFVDSTRKAATVGVHWFRRVPWVLLSAAVSQVPVGSVCLCRTCAGTCGAGVEL